MINMGLLPFLAEANKSNKCDAYSLSYFSFTFDNLPAVEWCLAGLNPKY